MHKELHPLNFEELEITREFSIGRTREAYEQKSLIYAKINGTERIFYSRIIEPFCLPAVLGNADTESEYSDIYIKAWLELSERGFLLVPNVWKMRHDKVATTFLTEFGGGIYDQKVDGVVERDTFDTDRSFIKININNIGSAARQLALNANKSYVELAADGPFHIYLDDKGNWNLILLDIGKIRIHESKKTFGVAEKNNNIFYTREAVRKFEVIQNNIFTLRQARGLI